MAKVGRPRVLDEAKRREICALVSAGAGIQSAARYVGCSRSTVYHEAQQDEEFRQQLRRAKATVALSPLQALRRAYQENWRAAAWMLERTEPEQFGRSYRNAFGRRELAALARDLMAVVRDEIDHPIQCDRAIERMRALINYAMRHAWDTQRSGNAMRRAMRYFRNSNPKDDDWTNFNLGLDFSSSNSSNGLVDEEGISTNEGPEFRKAEAIDQLLEAISSKIPASTDHNAA